MILLAHVERGDLLGRGTACMKHGGTGKRRVLMKSERCVSVGLQKVLVGDAAGERVEARFW